MLQYCTIYQFSAQVLLENDKVEFVTETNLLGVIKNYQLTWDTNTDYLANCADSHLRLLLKMVEFNIPNEDLLNIYVLYIRSILEQSCQVWNSNLTLENITDLERIQKTACRIILQTDYSSYAEALETLNLESLYDRRATLCLKFARHCTRTSQAKDMFPLNQNDHHWNTRLREKYQVIMARTGRLQDSAVPSMQRLINKHAG